MFAPDSMFGSAAGFASELRAGEKPRRARTGEHGDDAEEDLLDALDGAPALVGALVRVRVVAGCVQDRDADVARGVDWPRWGSARASGGVGHARSAGALLGWNSGGLNFICWSESGWLAVWKSLGRASAPLGG